MMKKLLLLSSAVLAFSFGADAQNPQGYLSTSVIGQEPVPHGNGVLKTASTPTVINDVLHYYLNKYYFKTGKTDLKTYPYIQTNATNVSAAPPITFCGSRFDVPAGETVTVTGLEAYAQRVTPAANLTIPITIYLCNLNAQNMPILPAIDSIKTAVGFTAVTVVGGDFATARTMTTNFAILFRNSSGAAGDYARLMRTNGAIESNWQAAASDRCSDGNYGYVRYNGTFYSTREFTMAPGFGAGTDYEFLVAPRVTYTIQAGHTLPQGVVSLTDTATPPDTMCARTDLNFTNTSSKFYEHRMYNLNQFYRRWNLYSPFVITTPFQADSSITWDFEFLESMGDTRVFLPYVNTGSITIATGDGSRYPSSPCFINQFRARLKPMGAFGNDPQWIYNEDFITCFKFCNDDAVGIATNKASERISVYPNPAMNGKSVVSGLTGKNTVVVYDLLGQVISNQVTENTSVSIDLSSQPKGTYIVRILTSDNQNKMVKIVNAD